MLVRKNEWKGKGGRGKKRGKARKDRTHLEICEAHDTPEVLEDGDLRYRCGVETRDALSGSSGGSSDRIRRDTRARGHQGEKKCKVKKQRRSTKHPRTKIQGEKHLRGEWDTVVDGHQAVEHERCVFRTMSEPLTVVINDFAVRTYELAESIDIGILVGGRYTNPA